MATYYHAHAGDNGDIIEGAEHLAVLWDGVKGDDAQKVELNITKDEDSMSIDLSAMLTPEGAMAIGAALVLAGKHAKEANCG